MNAKKHACASILLGLALSLREKSFTPLLVATLVGVGIDIDHFLMARVKHGDWEALKQVISNPRLALADGEEVFSGDDGTEIYGVEYIILTHATEAIVFGWLAEKIGRTTGEAVTLTLALHTLLDLYDAKEYLKSRHLE